MPKDKCYQSIDNYALNYGFEQKYNVAEVPVLQSWTNAKLVEMADAVILLMNKGKLMKEVSRSVNTSKRRISKTGRQLLSKTV